MEKITKADLTAKLSANRFVILDFSSPGCAPCKKVPALVEEVLQEAADRDVRAYEVNIVDEPDIARQYFVMGVPTLIVFRGGQEIARFSSLPKKDKVVQSLKE